MENEIEEIGMNTTEKKEEQKVICPLCSVDIDECRHGNFAARML